MLIRIVVLLALAAGAGMAGARPAASQEGASSCRARPTDLPALEKSKARLERRIAKSQPASIEAAPKALSKDQTALLDVLLQIHCLKLQETAGADLAADARKRTASKTRGTSKVRSAVPPPPTDQRAEADRGSAAPGASRAGDAIEVVTYYATNRGRSGSTEPANVYTDTDAPLSYGRAVVSVPRTHQPGNLELPSIWKLERQADPAKHFVLKSVAPLNVDDARTEMWKALQTSQAKALLVYVHGYNMSFDETATRAAQLAYDLDFPGLPFFFSWPSAGKLLGYLRDADSARLSERAFDQALSDLNELPFKDVYIVAHSMGSRIVSEVMRSRIERGRTTPRISELLLAAPDINADLFRREIAPKLAEMQGAQTTVYASSSDWALIASKVVHGYRRVGETAGGVFVYPGLDTVDASSASPALRALGHSYLTDSAAVLKDIRSLLAKKLSAKDRGLTQAGTSPDLYWSLP
jgi:esterase/lipase superfamily enzyme